MIVTVRLKIHDEERLMFYKNDWKTIKKNVYMILNDKS